MTSPGGERRSLRVLHVFSALGVGGAETWLMALLRHLRAHPDSIPYSVQTDVCLTGGVTGVFDDEARELGARLYYIPYSRKTLFSFVREFRRVLGDGGYDAIHDHQDYTAGWHFLFGRGLLPAVRIAHVHNPYFCISEQKGVVRQLTLAMGKQLLSFVGARIIGTSREILRRYGFDTPRFRKLGPIAVHCGFDVSRFFGDPEAAHASICAEFDWPVDARVILFAGRLNTFFGNNRNQKNPNFALEVARAALARDPAVRMIVAGGGEETRRDLERQVEDWGLAGKIRLVGIRHDVPRLMIGSNMLLFPSLEEGLGMVAVEAQAAGLPVLASDAVPPECVVVPGLVHFRPLAAGARPWADAALGLLHMDRPAVGPCNDIVSRSAFSIGNSARRLIELYSGEGRGANG